MKAPVTSVHKSVCSALESFVKLRDEWIFHYPVYLNTFSLTYDLASLLSVRRPTNRPDALGGNFRRHDWSVGVPTFTYRHNIEIFVAVKSMIDQAKRDGHDIKPSQVIRFTRYDVRWVYIRKRGVTAPLPKKWLLVTDLPQNGEELMQAWKAKRPSWIRQFGNFRLDEEMRLSFRRELHDLFTNDGKVYLFSAPMAYFLRQQSNPKDPRAKYIEKRAGIKPIDTFFVFRCNSDVDPEKVKKLRAAVAAYYKLIFEAKDPKRYLQTKLPRQYGRIASTVGQPHPFPEIHSARALTQSDESKMVKRYADILAAHHRP